MGYDAMVLGRELINGKRRKETMATVLERNLSHSRAAYRFALSALPDPTSEHSWPIRQHGHEFSSRSQIESMVIELGWAFFCRYEGCVEEFLVKKMGVKLSKKESLKDWLHEQIKIPQEYIEPLEVYRIIRNALHHDDGAAIEGNRNLEIHLLPEHMENFFRFFIWIGEEVSRLTPPTTNRP